MHTKTPEPSFDVKELANNYASLSNEILQNATDKTAILLLLQGSIVGDKVMSSLK